MIDKTASGKRPKSQRRGPLGRLGGGNGNGSSDGASTTPKQDSDIIAINDLNVYFGDFQALKNIKLNFRQRGIFALIGPSGCGKSTLLRSINRMNDLIQHCRVEGSINYNGQDIYHHGVDPVYIRRKIGMVFQKPNPFPKSIYNNIVWGAKIHGRPGDHSELVEKCLRRTALWDEVKDKLHENALRLSGGQQQRLCIARAIAVSPDVILMDEPASALDPISTARIEELIIELKQRYTIIIVTHNMQQAGRISDKTAFFNVDERRTGYLVEYGETREMFVNPKEKATEAYISGRFG